MLHGTSNSNLFPIIQPCTGDHVWIQGFSFHQSFAKDTNFPHWRAGEGGWVIALSALFLRGSSKCVQNACRGREGVKKGQKTACALYVWPQTRKGEYLIHSSNRYLDSCSRAPSAFTIKTELRLILLDIGLLLALLILFNSSENISKLWPWNWKCTNLFHISAIYLRLVLSLPLLAFPESVELRAARCANWPLLVMGLEDDWRSAKSERHLTL